MTHRPDETASSDPLRRPSQEQPIPDPSAPESPPPERDVRQPSGEDPLRSSATSRVWLAAVGLTLLLVVLVVFVAQNTDRVDVSFLGWTWHPPLAVALLVSVVGGLALAVVAGTLRIWQLHRRVRRDARG
jgi:uncharacterized integral membrane protein